MDPEMEILVGAGTGSLSQFQMKKKRWLNPALSRGYKTFFMPSSVETLSLSCSSMIKCQHYINNCWHFNIYEEDKLQALVI